MSDNLKAVRKKSKGKTYYYHKDCPGRRRIISPPGTAAHDSELRRAHEADKTLTVTGTVAGNCADYRASVRFKRMAESTQRNFRRFLIAIENDFDALPIKAFESPKSVENIDLWRMKWEKHPRQAEPKSVTQQDSDFLASGARILKVHQRLATSGARCAHVFSRRDTLHLVVPQLAEDIPGQEPHMNGGNSDVDTILYRWRDGRFAEQARLPCPGGEDALFFENSEGAFLAFANLRTGRGPYETNTNSLIYREVSGEWHLDETIPSFAAKQWHHFSIGDREFLALAQGLTLPHQTPKGHGRSALFERIGGKWKEVQIFDGRWGYNWTDFEIAGRRYLAYADHVSPSLIYRWDGEAFTPYQSLAEQTGRAFRYFRHDGAHWLAFAAIGGASTLYRWNGELFVAYQSLGGAGGREFELIESAHGLFLVRVCFIEGTPAEPKTQLQSQISKWVDGKFELIEEFPTFGATSASYFRADGKDYLAVSDSLTPDVRFRQDMVIYELFLDRA